MKKIIICLLFICLCSCKYPDPNCCGDNSTTEVIDSSNILGTNEYYAENDTVEYSDEENKFLYDGPQEDTISAGDQLIITEIDSDGIIHLKKDY